MRYPLIHPSFDPPKGKARELIDKLIQLKQSGKNEGADEILALAELLSREDDLYFVNYAPLPASTVHRLCIEFLGYFSSFKSISNPIVGRVVKRQGWKDIPLAACGIHSATSGIAASLMASGITSGEVITTSLNFSGVPNAIMLAGAAPKFVDVNPDDFCMDLESLEKAVNKNTKAIVLVHFNQFVDLLPIDDILQKHGFNVPVIQDASLAMGSTCGGMPAGLINLGRNGATVYSFATSKIISGCGGAIVVTNDQPYVERIMSVAYQGWNLKGGEDLQFFGANFKMNDLNAAIVIEQLKKREAIFEKRRRLKSWYDRELADVVNTGKIAIQKVRSESVVTHYAVLLPGRRAIAEKLAQKGIMIGFWHVAHMQSIYQKRFGTKVGTLPVTESVADRISFLPFHTKLTEPDVKFICKTLKESL